VKLSRVTAIARNDWRILKRDPSYLVIMTLMPLLVMAFMRSAAKPVLVTEGLKNANGAEQVVPGVALLFSFFLVGNIAFATFREHGWGTWERLRASHASPGEILLGKTLVPLASLALQLTLLFGIGALLFRLRVRGSWLAVVLITAAYGLALVGLGLALLALCKSVMQVNAASNLGSLLLSGLGGALTPLSTIPSWARAVAPATPSYWAMRGYRNAILRPTAASASWPSLVALGLFAVGFAIFARLRFQIDESKINWS
jgi:ABC-2 type transport system permease protein